LCAPDGADWREQVGIFDLAVCLIIGDWGKKKSNVELRDLTPITTFCYGYEVNIRSRLKTM